MRQKKEPSEEEKLKAKMAVVAASFAYGVKDHHIMRVPRGEERVAVARQTAYWLLRKSGMKYETIASVMGKKDHATPIHGYNHIENILQINLDSGYAGCVRNAAKHYRSFYKRYEELNRERKVKELENAF